ncbi:MAG: glycosyltransferase [Deltaproteobacteria bacterium]|nr:glycosyltransferase [Deltaproteobacteria bacterium]
MAQDDAFFLFACREKTPAAREIASRLRAAAARNELDANFAILPDMPDIREFLHLVDVLVMPLRTLYAKMDIPLVIIEALEAGVPLVIDSAPSPLQEIFRREVGVIVRKNKGETLSGGIASLLIDRNFAVRCSENARLVYREMFTAERMAAEVEEFYQLL